jgi:BirA family biotin operon repressor/biotin-[acetyl-CoA-carboxylase] ligase
LIRPFFMEEQLLSTLSDLPLGEIRVHDRIGSTNDEALRWAAEGARDMSLVVANEQTRGRGRMGREWYTPRDSALAFSLVLRPNSVEKAHPSHLTGLLTLSMVDCLDSLELTAGIKWPNDVLVDGNKVAGVLVESTWSGENPEAFVLGMGVNVLPDSVPPNHKLQFPATCIAHAIGRPISREDLLYEILKGTLAWRSRIGTREFLRIWEQRLAYLGQQIRLEPAKRTPILGVLLGLDREGHLQVLDEHGETITVHHGDVHLRPMT